MSVLLSDAQAEIVDMALDAQAQTIAIHTMRIRTTNLTAKQMDESLDAIDAAMTNTKMFISTIFKDARNASN